MIKGISILFATTILAGCSVDFSDTLPDYTGSDAAYIRVENTLQPMPYKIEKQIPAGNCWKSDKTYGITSKVAIAGIKVRTSKSVQGIAPPSADFANKSYQEYTIQPGFTYGVGWRREERSMYGIDLGQTYSGSFHADKGHTYEISNDHNEVRIVDLSKDASPTTKSLPECNYNRDMFGKKQYL
ncbi:hypothetical protein V2E67_005344 [Citrobacter freundii]|nr:hypothetical protein [Citrobacter freundii]EMF0721070.1 hypothetical protein [Citrobacter freundii]